MSQGTLHWNDWFRSPGCRHHMDRNSFAGVAFTSIFYDGMRAIEREIPSGRIFQEAEKLIRANSPVGFNRQDAESFLYYGRFTFGAGSRRGTLRFEGPALPEDRDVWATVRRGSTRIDINFYNLIDYANAQFPQNQQGVRRLAVLSGAVVLHEVMHVEGFHHGDSPPHADDNPAHPYNRTLNEIAGQALGNIYYSDFIFLHGQANLPHVICGANGAGFQPEHGLTEFHEDVPLFESELEFRSQKRENKK